jgi:hypothetical protein
MEMSGQLHAPAALPQRHIDWAITAIIIIIIIIIIINFITTVLFFGIIIKDWSCSQVKWQTWVNEMVGYHFRFSF